MYDKIKDIYKNLGEDEFVPLMEGIDSSLLGLYEINKKGQVRRVSDGRILKVTSRRNHQYPMVCLRNNNNRRNYKIHRLLALTFIENPNPDIYKVVDHRDQNKENFSLDNLRWASFSLNNKNRSLKENSYKRYLWWVSADKKSFSKTDPGDSTWTRYFTNEEDLLNRFGFPEDWKPIPDSTGTYCSSSGLVLFTSRYNYITTGCTDSRGYKAVNISGKKWLVHRLVYSLFSEDSDIDDFYIDHVNTLITDNRHENLRKVSQKDNMNNPLTIKHLSRPVCCFDLKGNFIKEYQSCIEAYKDLGVSRTRSNISRCCKGEKKTYKGYIWKYKDDENNSNIQG